MFSLCMNIASSPTNTLSTMSGVHGSTNIENSVPEIARAAAAQTEERETIFDIRNTRINVPSAIHPTRQSTAIAAASPTEIAFPPLNL